jgi:hypothetical protein
LPLRVQDIDFARNEILVREGRIDETRHDKSFYGMEAAETKGLVAAR